jgi:pimeloyl-ACP methyl ester carboxylesterase
MSLEPRARAGDSALAISEQKLDLAERPSDVFELARVPPAIRTVGREALAFARQAVLLHRDVGSTLPERVRAGEDVVVLLHGLFATAGVLRPLRRSIEQSAAGAHTAAFSYAPGPGVESVARRLGELVRWLPSGVRIHLVGHSLGGLAARWFVQELGGDPRVAQTISLASPFRGTRHARLLPGPAGRDITPGSELLQRLEHRALSAVHVPHISIAAERDAVVTESTLFPFGDRLVVPHCGHNALLFHPRVAAIVAQRVRERRAELIALVA